jgi:hypothetical protein
MRFILAFITILYCSIVTNGQCVIKELSITATECNVNGDFFVSINFEHNGTTNQFSIKGNGKDYGKFSYSTLPVKLGPLNADCVTPYEFVVRDLINTECFAFDELGKKCCSDNCKISFSNVEVDTCKGSTYGLFFSVEHKTAEVSEGFILYNNGLPYDTLSYGNRIKLPSFPAADNELFSTIVICDFLNPTCCDTLTIVNPCECGIYDIKSQIVDCNDDLENFDIRIDFKYNMVSDSFVIGGNSQTYGTFAYKDLPIKLQDLPFTSATEYEFLILDSENALCFTTYELGKIDECRFECGIDDVKISKGECVGDSIYLWLSFKHKNGSLEGFTVLGNGASYGNFQYGLDRYKIGPFVQDCDFQREFIVKDAGIIGCQDFVVYNEPLCCDCQISGLDLEEICDGNKLVAFDLDFDHFNSPSDQYILVINGVNRGKFNYIDLPLKITNISGLEQTIEIKIFDSKSEACRLVESYTFDCILSGPCVFDGLTFKESDCRADSTFFVVVKFVPVNSGLSGFIVKVNGTILDTLAYHPSNTYEIGPLNGDCVTKYKFVLQDIAKPDCRKEFALEKPVCCGDDCEVSSPTLLYGDCVNGIYTATINFKHENTAAKFKIKINNEVRGPFTYASLPITLEGLKGGITYEVVVQDGEFEDCKFSFLIPAIECTTAVTQNELALLIKTTFFDDKLIVRVPFSDKYSIDIIDSQGKLAASIESDQSQVEFASTSWPNGIYFVRIFTKNGVVSKGIIKL